MRQTGNWKMGNDANICHVHKSVDLFPCKKNPCVHKIYLPGHFQVVKIEIIHLYCTYFRLQILVILAFLNNIPGLNTDFWKK